MAIKNKMELFVLMLSNARHCAERSIKIGQEMTQLAQEPQIKEALEARLFIANKMLATFDECFRLIGQKPVQTTNRLGEVFLEDFKRELGEIQLPEAKRLFVLNKIVHLVHLQIGELVALVAAADMTGKFGVGVLLESVLADKLAFVERTRRFIRNVVEGRIIEKAAA